LIKKIEIKFPAVNFFSILGHQTPDPDLGSGSGIRNPDPQSESAIRKNAGSGSVSGSALNQCGSETLHFSKIKSQKESKNSRNQGFSYYFCMMIEGSESIPLTSGAGSGRPKNMWIRWMRIRIRIRNTGFGN
jgi:hypothetical protein